MHKLDRTSVPAPACLSHYRPGRDTWETTPTTTGVLPADKAAIRADLFRLQGQRCAYCEGKLGAYDATKSRQHPSVPHIEHFVQRSRDASKTFDWDNLFWSCTYPDTCGKHKDRVAGSYAAPDLIKPDTDDPEQFFRFVFDGTITPLDSLNAAERHRADTTLRVFNLDHDSGTLRKRRENAVRGYLDTGDFIRECALTLPSEEWLPFLDAEVAQTSGEEFATAIKHALRYGRTAAYG